MKTSCFILIKHDLRFGKRIRTHCVIQHTAGVPQGLWTFWGTPFFAFKNFNSLFGLVLLQFVIG